MFLLQNNEQHAQDRVFIQHKVELFKYGPRLLCVRKTQMFVFFFFWFLFLVCSRPFA